MKKLVMSILIVLAGLFAVDRLGGAAMGLVCKFSNDGFSPKFRYLQNGIHEDIVFLGASRCQHHYVPGIIADSLGKSVYNAGFGNSDNIYSHYIVLNHILDRYTPEMICLEVMPSDYNLQDDPFVFISMFAPLFGKCKGADSVFRQAGTYWRYKVSLLYRYNARASSNLWGLIINREQRNDRGYTPLLPSSSFPDRIRLEEKDTGVDQQKIEYLHHFVDLCRQNGVKVVFVVSPKYTRVDGTHYDILKDFAEAQSIPFLDYHTPGLYLDHPEYFKDEGHLWDKGARLYSSVIAQDLKALFK